MILFRVLMDTRELLQAVLPVAPVPKRCVDAAIRLLSELGSADIL